jgi:hypothetical protein
MCLQISFGSPGVVARNVTLSRKGRSKKEKLTSEHDCYQTSDVRRQMSDVEAVDPRRVERERFSINKVMFEVGSLMFDVQS